MKFTDLRRLIAACLLLALATACTGGSSGRQFGPGDAVLDRITVSGIAQDLVQDGLIVLPSTPPGAFPNAEIRFFFLGPVSAASLPADGPALGSITIADVATSAPAQGRWSIEGANNNIAVFSAFVPMDLSDPCSAGLTPNATYGVFLPKSQGGNIDVVMIGGLPLSQSASAQFVVGDCDPDSPLLFDAVPGPPMIIPNTPPALDATTPMIDPTAIAIGGSASRIVIDFNEAIVESSFSDESNPGGIQILNLSANPGVEIPVAIASIQFHQIGAIPGVSLARLTLTTTSELADGDVYEIRLLNISDFSQNLLSTQPGELQFTVIDQLDDQLFTFNEDFSTTDNLAEIPQGSAIVWAGTGTVDATFPIDVVGTGALGTGLISTPMVINTDDFTDLSINPSATPGFTLSFTSTTDELPGESNFSVGIRASGTIDIGGGTILDCNGRDGAPGGSLGAAPTMLTRGGGGGGDSLITGSVIFDRPGAAGGGGGGGLRISAGGTITLGSLVQLNCQGGDGGSVVIPGKGGGGSGGSILIQTFDEISFGVTDILQTRGGAGGTGGSTDSAGGMGGDGVIQLEDSNASALLTSALSLLISDEILPRAFQFLGKVSGLAISDPIDTGSISTNYTSASAIFNNGLTGTAEVFVRGLAENPEVPGTAATTMTTSGGVPLMSAAVTLANISQLNGYRFFRLEINTNFPPPPVTAIGDLLPSVSDVTVSYSRQGHSS
ncbi:MAG: hypothetical protein V3W41_10505 [Planctomycetota bacterium]